MPTIAVALEANQVRAEHALQNVFASWQAAQELAGWERAVQEEADIHVRYALPQHAGQEHEVVVVDDHNVAGLVKLEDLVGKLLVHAVVVGPVDALFPAV